MKDIAFIVNPIAGTHTKSRVNKMIREALDSTQFIPTIVYTEYVGHATQLAEQFAREGYYAVVAVGGDGTVNEVASGLRHTDTALGIIPNGSGNGFARHLNIPLRFTRSVEMLNRSEVITADYGMVNGRPFFCTSGIGFDALVAHQFAEGNGRGFRNYLHHIIEDLFHYQPETYHLVGDNIDITTEAFLITFANAGQWGYDAYIAPKASIQDGLMDIAILTRFPFTAAPGLALSLFTKNIDEAELYMNTIRTRKVTISRTQSGPMHIDGEALSMPTELHLEIIPDGIKILVEKRF